MPSRPCWVEISTRTVEDNYRFLKSIAPPQAELLAIVKADAYGHSLSACAPAAVRAGAGWLGVTSVEEGVRARTACPNAQILVMGGIFAGQGAAVVEHKLASVAWESHQLDELENAARSANSPAGSVLIHLEIDTGMSRQGVSVADLDPVLAKFAPASPLRLDGVMTHLYASDESDGEATARQLSCLDQALSSLEAGRQGCSLRPEWLSVGASAALLGNEAGAIAALAARHGLKPMLRPGLALYGVIPRYDPPYVGSEEPATLTRARKALAPVLAWKTRAVCIREVPAGAQIGYNGTFVATEPMRLALLAVGYADGLDRRLGNRFSLLIRGERAPLVGRVSMDQSVIDVTEIPGVEAGDEVVILGSQGNDTVTAFDHADAAGTIPWEVFTRIGPRVPRIEV
jgi:alanine racemase